MKTNDYIRLGAISLLSHLAQGAAFVLLFAAFGGTGAASSFPFAPPVGLVFGVVYVAALSFLFGWGLRPGREIDKNRCWNAAMALYALNLVSLLALPVPFGSGSILAMVWQLAMTPAMAGINGLSGEGAMFRYALFALLAAVEPLCLTLGLLGKEKKSGGEKQTENPAKSSAEAETATINEENNTNA